MRKNKIDNSALKNALDYAAEGIRIIWIPKNQKGPIEKDWPKKATLNPEEIKRWARLHPGCNFGLVMGEGLIAIDVDEGSRLSELSSLGFPATRIHLTQKGAHLLYRVPKNAQIRNRTRVEGFPVAIDVRSAGGQVVCPGSIHPSGYVYQKPQDNHSIASLPVALISKLSANEEGPKASAGSTGSTIPEGQRNVRLTQLAGRMRRRGESENVILAALKEKNKECDPPLPEREVEKIAHSISRYSPTEHALNDSRPRILLPGDDRLLSETAVELGKYLAEELFVHNGEIVILDENVLHPVDAQEFRTLIEDHLVCCKRRSNSRNGVYEVGLTMTEADARGILASPQLKEQLRSVKRVNSVRLPVLRSNERIELLPNGYDAETETFTTNAVEYDEKVSFKDAIAVLSDLFGEFKFSDGSRSEAVAVAALLGLYAQQIVPSGELRPAFVFTKNAEGAGATTLAACVAVPIIGSLPTGGAAKDDDEMRKSLTAALRTGQQVIFLDNLKGQLNSASLERFVTTPVWNDRLLGANEMFTGPNNATVIVTANGLTVSPDWRRRSLFAELHLSEERAEDRNFKRPISVPVLQRMRREILAACWSLVRNWDAMGRPQPSRSHSAFPAWASVVGGIVESAGYSCPFTTAIVAMAADEDGDSMRSLARAMKNGKKYKFQELVALCEKQELFTSLVTEMNASRISAFGRMLGRYNDRLVGDYRFVIEGKGHARRFWAERINQEDARSHGQARCSPRNAKYLKNPLRIMTVHDRATVQTPSTPKTGKVFKFANRYKAKRA